MSTGFNPAFERYEIPKNGSLPIDDLSGCIAFTRDTQQVGWIHILIHIAQKIHKFIFRRTADANLCHGMILLGQQPDEEGRIVLAHSVFGGIRTSKRDYLKEKDVTSLVIYRPKDQNLRERIAKYATRTSFNPLTEGPEQKDSKAKFSIKDMVVSFFHNRKETTMQNSVQQRLSRAVVNLLQKNTICDDKDEPRDLFCTPYAMFVLQSSQLISEMSKDTRKAIRNAESTDKAIQMVLELLNDQETSVGKCYHKYDHLRIDAKYAMSSYSCHHLDKVSEEKRVGERIYPFPLDQFREKHHVVDITENWKSDKEIEETHDKTLARIKRLHNEISNGSTLAKIKRVVIPILYAMTLIGIGVAIRFNRMYKVYSMQQKFMEEAETKNPPEITGNIQLHSKTMTFNHVANYAIHDGIIWTKSRVKPDAEWEPIYFPGYPSRTPKQLHADGANLIVIDENDCVHYKKVIGEKSHVERNTYVFYDKSTKLNWKEEWYSFPYLKHIVNFFTGKQLSLPKGHRDWAISHRGQFSGYVEDRDLNQHHTTIGVTTLFVLDKEGRYLYLFDPWKPKHVLVKVPVPETSGSPFVADRISVAGSVVTLVGYKYEDGVARPAIKTMLFDLDTLGWNPFLKYTYESANKTDEERVLPTVEGWDEHSIPQGATTNVTIVQTGMGNDAKELRVAAEYNGIPGYWAKPLDEENWQFYEDDNAVLGERLEEKAAASEEVPAPHAKNWENTDASLDSFSNKSLFGRLSYKGNNYLLHRKDNIILQILSNGMEFNHYDLVDEATAEVRKVKIVQEGDSLDIVERGFFKRNRLRISLRQSV